MPIFLFCKYMEMIAKNMTESWCLWLSDDLENFKGFGKMAGSDDQASAE